MDIVTTTETPAEISIPSSGTIRSIQDAILDVLAEHCAPEDRQKVFKETHRPLVEHLVLASFRSPDADARTPEQILIRIGMFCELRGISLNTGGAELLRRLNALLRGGGESLRPLD